MTDLSNINEVMQLLEEKAVHTREGSFVKLDDVRRLIEEKKNATPDHPELPERMTVEQARAAVKRDPEIMKHFPSGPQEPGRSIAASEPQPSSRT